MRKLKLAVLSLLAIACSAGALYAADVVADRKYVVEVISPEPLYELPPSEYPAFNPVVATLVPGQVLRVLRVRYGKDFESLRVQSPSGKSGWVFTGGAVRVLSRG